MVHNSNALLFRAYIMFLHCIFLCNNIQLSSLFFLQKVQLACSIFVATLPTSSSCHHIFLPGLFSVKPIRDLSASCPINYLPNHCRPLWYGIICQITTDGWGPVPQCQRRCPPGNLFAWVDSPSRPIPINGKSLYAGGTEFSPVPKDVSGITLLASSLANPGTSSL